MEHRLGSGGILLQKKGVAGSCCDASGVVDTPAGNGANLRNRAVTLGLKPGFDGGWELQILPASSASSSPRTERSTIR